MHAAAVDIQASYARLLHRLPGMAYRCTVDENYNYTLEFVSNGSHALLGMSPEMLVGSGTNTIEQMMPPEDLKLVRDTIYDSIVARTSYQIMYRLHPPTGQLKWVWDQGEAVYDTQGVVRHLEGLMMDVSEQKLQELTLLEENRQIKLLIDSMYGLGNIVGKSEAMRQVYNLILKAAESDTNVIIYGETGTGKDVVARAIHEYSGRTGAYIPVNCGAIPEQLLESEFFGHMKGAFSGAHANKEGYIAAAHNGTLFLDEIAELPLHLQVKLLRAIENKMYTPVGSHTPTQSAFRLVAATNQDMAQLVREKKVRSDFYYRINVLKITLPPLRQRQGDIPLLVDALCKRKGLELNLPPHVRVAMEQYDWPGNVRELHNFLDRYAAFGEAALEDFSGLAQADMFFPATLKGITLEAAVLQLEERLIRQTLEDCRWQRAKTAERLGLNLRTLQRKMKRLRMNEES